MGLFFNTGGIWYKYNFLKMQIVHVESNGLSTYTGLWEQCMQGNIVLLFYNPVILCHFAVVELWQLVPSVQKMVYILFMC